MKQDVDVKLNDCLQTDKSLIAELLVYKINYRNLVTIFTGDIKEKTLPFFPKV